MGVFLPVKTVSALVIQFPGHKASCSHAGNQNDSGSDSNSSADARNRVI